MTERMYELEQSYLYAGGCQMNPEEPENITCDCGHECEQDEEHRIDGETLCPKCYAKYRSDLIRKMETLFRDKFTEDDLAIIYDEDLLSEVNL